MNRMKYRSLLVASILIIGAALVSPAFAQTPDQGSSIPTNGMWGKRPGGMMQTMPGIFGKVTAVNGTTLTVSDTRTDTSYTVDASGATVMKNGSASSLSSVAVGDTVFVQGTVSGTNVTATTIRDGVPMNGIGDGRGQG